MAHPRAPAAPFHQQRWARLAAAAIIVAVALTLSTAVAIGGIRSGWTGHADSANTVVVARNLLRHGTFTVDYVASYATPWPTVQHPEDSFPLLQPLLIAGIASFLGDVVAAAHLLSAVLLLVYLGGLPLVTLAWHGPLPALVLLAGLLTQEGYGSYFDRPLNDPGAMVLVGAGWLALLRCLQPAAASGAPGSRWRSQAPFVAMVTSFVIAGQYKSSTIFAVVAATVALVTLDPWRPARRRLGRAALLVSCVAVAHVPVLIWHWAHFGHLGLPHNAAGRDFVRTMGPHSDFWVEWQRIRTYAPAHPDAFPSFGEYVARAGLLESLVHAPARRLAAALRLGMGRGEVIPIAWLAASVMAASQRLRSHAASAPARLTLLALAALMGAVVFSHYEMRYFAPLRPLLALSAALAVKDALAHLPPPRRPTVAAAVIVSVAAFWIVSVGGGAASGVNRLLAIARPRANPGRDAGAMIRSATAHGDVVMARDVFQLSFFADRPMVVVPHHTSDICAAAQRYGARWLALDPAQRNQQEGLERFTATLSPHGEAAGVTLYRLECDAREGR